MHSPFVRISTRRVVSTSYGIPKDPGVPVSATLVMHVDLKHARESIGPFFYVHITIYALQTLAVIIVGGWGCSSFNVRWR